MQARMEHSSKQCLVDFAHIQQQQGLALGSTQSLLSNPPSSEASAVSSQSASSAVISPGDGGEPPCESSGQSGSSLKEHDYIGLADVSSVSSMSQAEKGAHVQQRDLNLEETDLRLGLGPAKETSKMGQDSIHGALGPKKNDPMDAKEFPWPLKTAPLRSSHGQEAAYAIRDGAHMHPPLSSTWKTSSLKSLDGVAIPPIFAFASSVMGVPSKNGVKRFYSETMAEAARDARPGANTNSGSALMINTGDGRPGVNFTSGASMVMMQLQDAEVKSHTKHQQNVYWAVPQVPSAWQSGLEHSTSSSCPSSRKSVIFAAPTADKDVVSKNRQLGVTSNQETAPDDSPPAKGQVVGWPPVRSYRRSTLAAHPMPAGEDGDGQSAIYVKVNMDGIPIGRKVDLSAYSSYEGLLSALEGMFHSPNSGQGIRFLNGSEFVLTYEDKEGDWMLVGDVPWGMFVNTVRRLRIMCGSDTTSLGSRTPKCHS